nr:MAG TPA: hypothetical protein [Caudoviricetes sp.]
MQSRDSNKKLRKRYILTFLHIFLCFAHLF